MTDKGLGFKAGNQFYPSTAMTASGMPLIGSPYMGKTLNAYDLAKEDSSKYGNPYLAIQNQLMNNTPPWMSNTTTPNQAQVTVPQTTGATEIVPTSTAEQAGGGNWLTNMFNRPSVEGVPASNDITNVVEKGPSLFKQSKDFFGSDKGQATSAIAGAGVGLVSGLAKAGMQDKYDPRVGMSKPNLGGNLFGDATFTQVGLNPALMAATGGISALVGGGVDLIKNAVKYSKQKDRYENKKLATDTMQSIDDARENMKPDYTGYARSGTQVNPYLKKFNPGGKVIVDGKEMSTDSDEYKNLYNAGVLMGVDYEGLPNMYAPEVEVTAQMTDKERVKRGLMTESHRRDKAAMGELGNAFAEFTGIPSLIRVGKDPVGHLQSALKTMDGIATLGTMPYDTYNTPEDLSKALDVVGAAGTVSPFVKPVVSGINQVAKTFKPSYMSLDAPMGKMFGQNQVLTQQSRFLDPKIKAKYFEHQAPPSGPKRGYEKIPPDYNNRITNENYEDFVNNIHGSTDYDLSKEFGKQPKNLGIGSYGSPGAVFSDAPLSNLQKDIINAHEKNHGIFAGTLSSKMKSDLRKPFPTNKPIPNYSDKHQADEILARMAQFKNAIGMSDNQVFTLGHLNYIRNNYSKLFTDNSITAMLSKIKPGSIGEKQFLKNMNKYAFGIGVPATIATGIGMSSSENK
jgi:hypothetical protein